jgi:hypothetical protein
MQVGHCGRHIVHPRRAPPFVRQRASPTSASAPAWDEVRARGEAWASPCDDRLGRRSKDPPTAEEIIAVMRQTSDDRHGFTLRALIVVLWRGGLRIRHAGLRNPLLRGGRPA